MSPRVLTVGHSTQSLEEFLSLLSPNGVTVIADVRSTPFSRFTPYFNRDVLRAALVRRGIGYVFLGNELGARSEDKNCYVQGRVQYSLLAKTSLFQAGIDRVILGAATERIALMCAEKDPLDCHRTILISRSLVACGIGVDHILANGSIESHAAAMDRLLEKFDLQAPNLFCSSDELIADALLRQEERIAYVDAEMSSVGRVS